MQCTEPELERSEFATSGPGKGHFAPLEIIFGAST